MAYNSLTKGKTLSRGSYTKGNATVTGTLTVGGVLQNTTTPSLTTCTVSGATTTGTLAVGGGTTVKEVLKVTATITPTGNSIAAGATYEGSVTVTGARAGDDVTANPPAAIEADLVWSAYVSANDTVKVRILNGTAAPITTAARSWVVTWTDLT